MSTVIMGICIAVAVWAGISILAKIGEGFDRRDKS